MVKKTHRFRVLLVALFAMLAFGGIEAKLYQIQIAQHSHYTRLAKSQQNKTVVLNRRRGDILDRTGQVLATSTFFDSVFFNPAAKKGDLPKNLAARLARVIDEPKDKVAGLLAKDKVTRIKSKVPPEVADAVRVLEDDLRLPDGLLFYVKDSKRLYPKGGTAGVVIGFAGTDETGDNEGLEGIERQYNDRLKGSEAQQRVAVNSWRQGLEPMDEAALNKTFGQSVVLTLDTQLQLYAEKALRKRVGEVQAKAGAAIIMDVKSGGLLALATCPDYDPNDFSRATPSQRRDVVLTDPFEIGSVMKILTATILLDNGLLSPDEKIYCEDGKWQINGRTITDSHPIEGSVPFRVAFAESSNVGLVKVGMRLEPNLYYKSLRKFGLGGRLGIDLPGENGGILRPVSEWTVLSRSSLPMGYETALSALQVVTAVSAIGNHGMRLKPRIVEKIISADGQTVEEFPPQEVTRVAGTETCKTIIELMEGAVSDGTATLAQVPGYRVAAKTGTTKKHADQKRYIASIVGLMPAENPQVAIYIFIDEPDPKIEYYGGKVAGPVLAEIGKETVRILGIPPSNKEAMRHAREIAAATGASNPKLAGILEENIDGGDSMTVKDAALGARELVSVWHSLDDQAPAPGGDSKPSSGRMPSYLGLTMSEVVSLAAKSEVEVQLFGTGIAVRQSPAPGAIIREGDSPKVIFASPSQKLEPESGAPVGEVKGSPALPDMIEAPATGEKEKSAKASESN